jgi:hypothetical protein
VVCRACTWKSESKDLTGVIVDRDFHGLVGRELRVFYGSL